MPLDMLFEYSLLAIFKGLRLAEARFVVESAKRTIATSSCSRKSPVFDGHRHGKSSSSEVLGD